MSQGRIELLQKMLEADPNDAFCRYGMAQEYLKAGDYVNAVLWFDKTIESDIDYCYAYYHKARAFEQAGKLQEAISTLQIGLERARASGDAHTISEIQSLLDQLT